MATDDPLRPALLSALGKRPSVAQRRKLAALLRSLADEQERLAEAEARQQTRPSGERLSRRHAGGRPSSPWIRIERSARRGGMADEVRIKLSRALYYAAARPERLDVQRVGGVLLLIPARGDAGYRLNVSSSYAGINASGARDLLDGMEDGRYGAVVVGGRIEVGEMLG